MNRKKKHVYTCIYLFSCCPSAEAPVWCNNVGKSVLLLKSGCYRSALTVNAAKFRALTGISNPPVKQIPLRERAVNVRSLVLFPSSLWLDPSVGQQSSHVGDAVYVEPLIDPCDAGKTNQFACVSTRQPGCCYVPLCVCVWRVTWL